MNKLLIKKTSPFALLLLSLCNISYASQPDYNYPPFVFDPAPLAQAQPIKPECRHLSIDQTSNKETKFDIPTEAFRERKVVYAVYDFQIDKEGNVIDVELASPQAKKYFVRNSKKALNNLKFTVDTEWLNNCLEQKYRIGYAFRIMSSCTYKEFPAPIINMCANGVAVKIN